MRSLNEKLAKTAILQQESQKRSKPRVQERTLEERMFRLCRDQLGMTMDADHLRLLNDRLHFFLQTLQLSPVEMDGLVHRMPHLLRASTDKQFIPLARFCLKRGISERELGQIVIQCPDFLLVPVRHDLKLKMFYLESVGMTRKVVVDLIRTRTFLFTCHFEFDFRRKSDHLLDAGLSVEALLSLMRYSDQLFCHPVEQNIFPKLRFFAERGYSIERISEMIERHPFLYFASLDKVIRPFFEQRSASSLG